jgi:hypothetical protein
MSDNTIDTQPEDEESPCPACRICKNKRPCYHYRKCVRYQDWFEETWGNIRKTFRRKEI